MHISRLISASLCDILSSFGQLLGHGRNVGYNLFPKTH
jgi:hypothetical protein